MGDLFLLLLIATGFSNIALTYLLGINFQHSVSKRMEASSLMGIATLFLLVLSLPVTYILNQRLIIPFELQKFDLLFYIVIMLGVVLVLKFIIRNFFPLLNEKINIILPVLLINTVILALIPVLEPQINSIADSSIFGLGTGLGFLLLILVITCLRERLDNKYVPEAFRGVPLLLISMGILSMGLLGLAGW
jgi:electron transport complex protein RnfA